ncbi:alpha/beta hydrolase [Ligilactobacillus salivarius]
MKQPLLMITGDISDTRYMTDDFFKKQLEQMIRRLYILKHQIILKHIGNQSLLGKKLVKLLNFLNEKL